jgi:hypothetical protein
MGALRLSVEAMFKAVTGKPLETVAFGKPQMGTFQFATRLLQQWRKSTHGIDAPPETVYFVGDTPESDIRGTNEFNTTSDNTWYSILVKTGVYEEGTQPRYQPRVTVDNVLDAVNLGIQREQQREQKRLMKHALDVPGKFNLKGSAISDDLLTPTPGPQTLADPMESVKA